MVYAIRLLKNIGVFQKIVSMRIYYNYIGIASHELTIYENYVDKNNNFKQIDRHVK